MFNAIGRIKEIKVYEILGVKFCEYIALLFDHFIMPIWAM